MKIDGIKLTIETKNKDEVIDTIESSLIFDKEVKGFGKNQAHITLPGKLAGKQVRIIVLEEE